MRSIKVAPFGRAVTLDARVNGVLAELHRLQSERVELRWPGLKHAFVSGYQAIEDVASVYRLSTTKVYRIARECGWGRRMRRQSGISRVLVGEKLKTHWAMKNGGLHGQV